MLHLTTVLRFAIKSPGPATLACLIALATGEDGPDGDPIAVRQGRFKLWLQILNGLGPSSICDRIQDVFWCTCGY